MAMVEAAGLREAWHAEDDFPPLQRNPGPINLPGDFKGKLENFLRALANGCAEQKHIVHQTAEFVTLYDGHPKSSVHLLVIPIQRIKCLEKVDADHHLALLKRMKEYVNWVRNGVAKQYPHLPGWAEGFHAVPTLDQLHCHVVSLDFQSPCLNSTKQYNSFQPPFLVPLGEVVNALEEGFDMRTRFGLASVEDELQKELQCHRCHANFGQDVGQLKTHLMNCSHSQTVASLQGLGEDSWLREAELAQKAWGQADWALAASHLATCVRLHPGHEKTILQWQKAMDKHENDLLGQGLRIAGRPSPEFGLPVVFDMETDDPDDFICLLFLASHPLIKLKAVTITPGSAEQVGLVRWALERLGLDIRVGAANLNASAVINPWHAAAFFPGSTIPNRHDAEPAWQVLVQECDESTVLFTGGPLLNLKQAILNTRGTDQMFVAGTWLAQGGFAGDGLVPEDANSPFAGKGSHCTTTNFGREAKCPAADAAALALEHEGFRQKLLVSKNVCHHKENHFREEQLQRLLTNLQAHGVTERELADVALRSRGKDRYCLGQTLLAHGMREYIRTAGREKKAMHDPLAAMVMLDPHVVNLWAEVKMTQDKEGRWGAASRPNSGTFISLRHDPQRFWTTLLNPPATCNIGY
mmetsp:Transcript_46030/g.82886  ORF Transcript_46030/g.82886 Transcript_46030/m.82886 type:complete len:638 (-) Transcript_46030:82-1995(-)